jgi:hypothetical protein
MKRIVLLVALLVMPFHTDAAEVNLLANPDFEGNQGKDAPAGWNASGNRQIKQALQLDTGHDGKHAAHLVCSEFTGEGPDHHAMICQTGAVGVVKDHWYSLSLWSKAEGIKAGTIDVALSNTRVWQNAGLADSFAPSPAWQKFEFLFKATSGLPAEASRLQFWFKGTGDLWLDDVVLCETRVEPAWFPQVSTEGVKNFVPNSSFECGPANWGSYSWGFKTWGGNIYRLEGVIDTGTAAHGHNSLKISLDPGNSPVFNFDYYEPVSQPVRRVLVANKGWFRVVPGDKYTLSAQIKADEDGLTAQLLAMNAPERPMKKAVRVSREWKRYEYTFSPAQSFIFIAVGLDLEESGRERGAIRIDSIQLEKGDRATRYEPRSPVESFIECPGGGYVSTNPASGLSFTISAYNGGDKKAIITGDTTLTDFFERPAGTKHSELALGPGEGKSVSVTGLAAGKSGFFRVAWRAGSNSNSVRCAMIDPGLSRQEDSPFGFNHAYPWDYLVSLARQSGIVWWRDWSVKWNTVEPVKGAFDFSSADIQVRRVLEAGGEVDVLLPFPSAGWSTTAKSNELEKAAGDNSYLKARMPFAYAPADLADFGRYAAAAASHYAGVKPRGVRTFEILNEPVYTTYALSAKFGYGVPDYVKMLEIANAEIKKVRPDAMVVGGIGAHADARFTRDFVTSGGLRHADILDIHMYDAPRPAEAFDDVFGELQELMATNGVPKPVWITEWGCYADDDPPAYPFTFGDQTMSRCKWPDERAATEHIVKFAAISLSRGVTKIFVHAGTCGTINGADAGGMLFEYGGAPRKMLAGIAAFTSIVGVPEKCVARVADPDCRAVIFKIRNGHVAVAWKPANAASGRKLLKAGGGLLHDIMGNQLTGEVVLSETPVYMLGANPEDVMRGLGVPVPKVR